MQQSLVSDSSKSGAAPTASSIIGSVDDLVAHFQRGCKSPDALRIGLEHEKIGMALFPDGSVRPVPYAADENAPQIRALLSGLQKYDWQPILENGQAIALQRNGASVTLEPGGQFELSGPPLPSDEEAVADLDRHIAELLPLGDSLSIAFIGCGFRPLGTWNDVSWMPKGRYAVMREYLPTRGHLGVEMMKRTATVQANLDYTSEEDGVAKLRLGLALAPLVTAIYAASPLRDGQPCGYKSYRAACWLDTDPDRCGLLPFMFRHGVGFRDYAEWALDVPMFFVYRHKRYIPAGGLTFRSFVRDGFQEERATLSDWELHLSTLFPDARLKQYIELRSADAGPLTYVRALPALWRGLFYCADAKRAAWDLVKDLSVAAQATLRQEVPRLGLATPVPLRQGTVPIAVLCEQLLRISMEGLQRLGAEKGRQRLEPLLAAVQAGRCPADDILEAFHAARGDARAFVEALRLISPT